MSHFKKWWIFKLICHLWKTIIIAKYIKKMITFSTIHHNPNSWFLNNHCTYSIKKGWIRIIKIQNSTPTTWRWCLKTNIIYILIRCYMLLEVIYPFTILNPSYSLCLQLTPTISYHYICIFTILSAT